MSFDQLGLRTELLQAIASKGYTAPTPVQSSAIPSILDGRDILARAQTGTGKTDAFALPLVEILSRHIDRKRYPRALVLTPTRELALQVGESIKAYARRVSLRCTVVFGGINIMPQIERLHRGIDILVATPGRLLDLAGQGHLDLSRIEFLVFDEADRMLDLGFSKEISQILEILPAERRTMLFSATYTKEILNLAAILLKNPQKIEASPRTTAAELVIQKVHLVSQPHKRALLVHLLTTGRWSRALVFCRTRHGANRITEKLVEAGLLAAALHGNKSQSLRTRTLEAFRKGDLRILVATDVAARGLDITNLPYVVNYDMPAIPEDYIHRIGRTGRAGESGIAVSLVNPEEKQHLQAIEALLKQNIPVETVIGYSEATTISTFVPLRSDSIAREKKAKNLSKKQIPGGKAGRAVRKQEKTEGRRTRATGPGRRSDEGTPTPSTRRNEKAGKSTPRSGPEGSRSLKRGRRKG